MVSHLPLLQRTWDNSSTHITGGEQPSLILISGDPKLSSETSLGTRHAYGAHTYKINQSKQE